MIELKVLSENRDNGVFAGEGGLSILVNVAGESFLFDTGLSNLYMQNAKLLGVDLNKVNKVVLTHGHSDHTNGVKYLPGKTIILHPQAFKSRWSIRKKEQVGFNMTKEALESKHNVILATAPIEVCDNCIFLGEIPMVVDFEKDGNFSTTLDQGLTETDYTEDDSGVVIKTDKGLFVMTGCGHRGVCNTIEQAKKVTGQDKIYGVLGGFHLRNLDKQKEKIDLTIQYFKHNNIQQLYLGHCVADDVIDYFEQNLPNVKVNKLGSGKEFII